MKTSAKTVFILILLLTSSESFSLDTASARYFPLAVGNTWTYYVDMSPWPSYKFKKTITRDSVINGKKYFFLNYVYDWIRYDSLTSNFLVFRQGTNCSGYQNEGIIDSLASSINDKVNCPFGVFVHKECIANGSNEVFGLSKEYKEFQHDGLIFEKVTYSKDFGITKYCSGEAGPCYYGYLTGCIVNGILYGDTSLTIIKQIGNAIPDKFELKQNYPNPFNPATNIKFSIPKSGFVNLKVYDINGKEIAALVNENLQAGEYQTSFNASNLSSGIYFYTLTTGEFIETRRMVLVK
ncbi:MAG TPA: T9SS type A sorting domain-containing protein [Ignavibacteria bacterium]|nr:T9SS type A sorting domain-containing protein [Ignavibacteria bacterium]